MKELKYHKDGSIETVAFHYDKARALLRVGPNEYPCDGHTVEIEGRRIPFWVQRNEDTTSVWLDGEIYRFEIDDPRRRTANQSQKGSSDGTVKAHMPGKVLEVFVEVGEVVKEGANLALMESMKMELSLVAPFAGRIDSIQVAAGEMVSQGQPLIEIEKEQE